MNYISSTVDNACMTESSKQQTEKNDSSAVELAKKVGFRVRATRSRRGLTRKNLAHHSDVSERYLAQLESGSANISLSLLSRIAKALGVDVPSFLPVEETPLIKYEPLYELLTTFSLEEQKQADKILRETFEKNKQSRHGIALVGLRGAGKSTLGSLLAKHFDLPFVRLDEVISQLSGMDIGDLISLRGQDVYRRYELQALEKSINDYHWVVVETGGSLISEKGTYRLLRHHYFTVWIRAVAEDHMERVIDQGDLRPMAGDNTQAMRDLRLILEERESDYRLADHELMTSNRSIESCLQELIEKSTAVLKGNLNTKQ